MIFAIGLVLFVAGLTISACDDIGILIAFPGAIMMLASICILAWRHLP